MTNSDEIIILEISRIACATVPDIIVEKMDISDDEFIRIRDIIHSSLNRKKK